MSSALNYLESNAKPVENYQAKQTNYSPSLPTAVQQLQFDTIQLPTPLKKSSKLIIQKTEPHSILKCKQKSQTEQKSNIFIDATKLEDSTSFINATRIPKISSSYAPISKYRKILPSSEHSTAIQTRNILVDPNASQQSATLDTFLLLTIPQASASPINLLLTPSTLKQEQEASLNFSLDSYLPQKSTSSTNISVDSTLHQESLTNANHFPTELNRSDNSTSKTRELCSILKPCEISVSKALANQVSELSADKTTCKKFTSMPNLSYEKDTIETSSRASIEDKFLEVTDEINLDCSLAKLKTKLQKESPRLHLKKITIGSDMSKNTVSVSKKTKDLLASKILHKEFTQKQTNDFLDYSLETSESGSISFDKGNSVGKAKSILLADTIQTEKSGSNLKSIKNYVAEQTGDLSGNVFQTLESCSIETVKNKSFDANQIKGILDEVLQIVESSFIINSGEDSGAKQTSDFSANALQAVESCSNDPFKSINTFVPNKSSCMLNNVSKTVPSSDVPKSDKNSIAQTNDQANESQAFKFCSIFESSNSSVAKEESEVLGTLLEILEPSYCHQYTESSESEQTSSVLSNTVEQNVKSRICPFSTISVTSSSSLVDAIFDNFSENETVFTTSTDDAFLEIANAMNLASTLAKQKAELREEVFRLHKRKATALDIISKKLCLI